MPKTPKQKHLELYLADILKAITKINSYIAEMTYREFAQDDKTQDAVIRNLEIIGEATKPIPPAFKELEPGVPWKSYAGIRDIIAHYYFGVDLELIWDTVQHDLGKLKAAVEGLITKIKT